MYGGIRMAIFFLGGIVMAKVVYVMAYWRSGIYGGIIMASRMGRHIDTVCCWKKHGINDGFDCIVEALVAHRTRLGVGQNALA